TELAHDWYSGPACSPDGSLVAVVRAEVDEPTAVGDQTLVVVDLATGNARDITPELDLWPISPVWAPDGSTVYFTADKAGPSLSFPADKAGPSPLFRAGLSDGDVRMVDDQCAWTEDQPAPDNEMVYGLSSGY